MTVWRGQPDPTLRPIPITGWAYAALRLPPLVVVVYGGLALHLLVRLIERPLFANERPITSSITQAVCRLALAVMRLRLVRSGRPMNGVGAMVANHASWLDILALNACQRLYFVSKSEVAGWAGIGWLARATGTVFIARNRRDAKRQQRIFEERLRHGHRLLFFPEGTSTDCLRVLPFKSTLFAAFFTEGLEAVTQIQPVTVAYRAPPGEAASFYGWWGDMPFGSHFFRVLSAGPQGHVEVIFHDPVDVDDFASRKELAAHCEATVRAGHAAALGRLV